MVFTSTGEKFAICEEVAEFNFHEILKQDSWKIKIQQNHAVHLMEMSV